MIEAFFIITAVLMTNTFYVDVDACFEYKRDFMVFEGVEVGHLIFEHHGNDIDIQVMSTGKVPDELMIPVAYRIPIEGCVPK